MGLLAPDSCIYFVFYMHRSKSWQRFVYDGGAGHLK
jgi:hypothetical protein